MTSFSGRLLLDGALVPGRLVVEDGRIVTIRRGREDGPADITAPIIAPGYVDLQVNGGFGVEVCDGAEAIQHLMRRLPQSGVTAFLPTVITGPAEGYRQVIDAMGRLEPGGARPLGLHLEGPFLSPRRKGAHPEQYLLPPTAPLARELAASPHLRLMTLAPELPGALQLIQTLRGRNVIVSLGHSNATLEQFGHGAAAGATMATHLYNAMSPFEHRAPNVIGAALTDDRVTVGLIADGIHAHPAALELALRAKGPERIALVSDMVAAAGMPDGRYRLGGGEVELREGAVRRPDGTLAGSALLMDAAVRNMVRWTSASAADALRMASEIPARMLGLTHLGRLAEGCEADLVLLDDELHVQGTVIAGEVAATTEALD